MHAQVDNTTGDDRLGELRAQAAVRLRASGLGTEDDPHIAAWQDTYRRFGTNPRRSRPSAEALCRRLLRGDELPRINDVVDIYNVASVDSRLPCGAYDTDRLAPPVRLVLSPGGEAFRPIGARQDEHTAPGEVVYADRCRVLTRHWNHRDGEATKVQESTRSVLVLAEAAHPDIPDEAVGACVAQIVDLLTTHCAAIVLSQGVLQGHDRPGRP